MAPKDTLTVETVALGSEADAIAEEQLQSLTTAELQNRINNYRPERQVSPLVMAQSK